jgi:hypothetical protein
MPQTGGGCPIFSQDFICAFAPPLQRVDNALQFALSAWPDVQKRKLRRGVVIVSFLLSTTVRSLMAISCASK